MSFILKCSIKKCFQKYFFKLTQIYSFFRDTVDGGRENTKEVLAKFGIVPDDDDINIVQYVCEVASNRAALLVSICKFKILLLKFYTICSTCKLRVEKEFDFLYGCLILGVSALIERIDKEEITIAVDGSLYKHHPRFKNWMNHYISLLAPGYKVSIKNKMKSKIRIKFLMID